MPNPPKTVRQTMFTTGETDITVWKRTEIESYLSAAQSLLNMECGTTGLAKKRKSTRIVLTPTSGNFYSVDTNSQLYPFRDMNGVYYLLMSGNGIFQIFSINPTTLALTNIQTLTTPYLSAELPFVDWTLDGDSLVLTDGQYIASIPSYGRPPARIYVSSYSSNPPTFAYEVLPIYPYPAYDFSTINYSNYTVAFTNSGTTFSMVITGANAGNFSSAWVNGQVVSLGASPEQPIGYGIITSVTPGSGTATIAGNVVVPFALTADMPTIGSQYSIRQPAWSNTLGWPAHVLFYQNRLWFANTASLPLGIFGSKINQPVNFDVGVGNPADAIVYILGQSDANQILWMNGGKQLEIYTENYEFACPQTEDAALTPDTFSVRQQSAYGSSVFIKPVTYFNDSYFISKTQNMLVNFHFNGIGLTYTASNISVASQHLVKAPVNRGLIRGEPASSSLTGSQDNFIYFLNPDSTLTSLQFAHEYKLASLTPIQFQPNVVVQDICEVNNNLFFLKYFTSTAYYSFEVFDDSQRIDSWQTTGMLANGTISNLNYLIGYTVDVVYDGQDLGQYVVDPAGTVVVVGNPNSSPVNVQVGMLYPCQVTPMYVFAGSTEYAYIKRVSRIFVDYYNSINFQVNGYLVPYQTFANVQAGLPPQPMTGTYVIENQDGYNMFDTINITQNSPFDLQILGIAYQIDARLL